MGKIIMLVLMIKAHCYHRNRIKQKLEVIEVPIHQREILHLQLLISVKPSLKSSSKSNKHHITLSKSKCNDKYKNTPIN